ncbi:MAG: hypothetical protein D6695_08085 [Planctomycetota bacterium]|nr:MAG: hypothetical protein D6695_08085 [Planctomycetota bacterium]
MLCSIRAATKSLRAVTLVAALAAPVGLTSTAAADHDCGRSACRAPIGTLTIDGRRFDIYQCSSLHEIRRAFCRLGYDASIDGSRVVVRAGSCREPRFCWESCDYDLQSSWRGNCLILCLRPINRVRSYVGIGYEYDRYGSRRHSDDRRWPYGSSPGVFCVTREGGLSINFSRGFDFGWNSRSYDDRWHDRRFGSVRSWSSCDSNRRRRHD